MAKTEAKSGNDSAKDDDRPMTRREVVELMEVTSRLQKQQFDNLQSLVNSSRMEMLLKMEDTTFLTKFPKDRRITIPPAIAEYLELKDGDLIKVFVATKTKAHKTPDRDL